MSLGLAPPGLDSMMASTNQGYDYITTLQSPPQDHHQDIYSTGFSSNQEQNDLYSQQTLNTSNNVQQQQSTPDFTSSISTTPQMQPLLSTQLPSTSPLQSTTSQLQQQSQSTTTSQQQQSTSSSSTTTTTPSTTTQSDHTTTSKNNNNNNNNQQQPILNKTKSQIEYELLQSILLPETNSIRNYLESLTPYIGQQFVPSQSHHGNTQSSIPSTILPETLHFNTLLNSSIIIPYDIKNSLPSVYLTAPMDLVTPQDPLSTTPHTNHHQQQLLSLTPIAVLILSFLPQLPHFIPPNQHLRQVVPHLLDAILPKAQDLIHYGARIDPITFSTHCQVIQYTILSMINYTTLYIQQQSVYSGNIDSFAPPPFSTSTYPPPPLLSFDNNSTTNAQSSPNSNPPPGLSLTNDTNQSNNNNTNRAQPLQIQSQQLLSFFGVRLQPTLAHCTWLLFICSELLQISLQQHYEPIIGSLREKIDSLQSQLDSQTKSFQFAQQQWLIEREGFIQGNPSLVQALASAMNTTTTNSSSTQSSSSTTNNGQHSPNTESGGKLAHGARPFIPTSAMPHNNNGNNNNNPHELLPTKPKPILPSSAFPSLGSKKDKGKNKDSTTTTSTTTTTTTPSTTTITSTPNTTLQNKKDDEQPTKPATTTSSGKQLSLQEEKLLEKAIKAKEKKAEAKLAKKKALQAAAAAAAAANGNNNQSPQQPTTSQPTNTTNNKKDTQQPTSTGKGKNKPTTFNIDEFQKMTNPPGDNTPLPTSIRPQPYFGKQQPLPPQQQQQQQYNQQQLINNNKPGNPKQHQPPPQSLPPPHVQQPYLPPPHHGHPPPISPHQQLPPHGYPPGVPPPNLFPPVGVPPHLLPPHGSLGVGVPPFTNGLGVPPHPYYNPDYLPEDDEDDELLDEEYDDEYDDLYDDEDYYDEDDEELYPPNMPIPPIMSPMGVPPPTPGFFPPYYQHQIPPPHGVPPQFPPHPEYYNNQLPPHQQHHNEKRGYSSTLFIPPGK